MRTRVTLEPRRQSHNVHVFSLVVSREMDGHWIVSSSQTFRSAHYIHVHHILLSLPVEAFHGMKAVKQALGSHRRAHTQHVHHVKLIALTRVAATPFTGLTHNSHTYHLLASIM